MNWLIYLRIFNIRKRMKPFHPNWWCTKTSGRRCCSTPSTDTTYAYSPTGKRAQGSPTRWWASKRWMAKKVSFRKSAKICSQEWNARRATMLNTTLKSRTWKFIASAFAIYWTRKIRAIWEFGSIPCWGPTSRIWANLPSLVIRIFMILLTRGTKLGQSEILTYFQKLSNGTKLFNKIVQIIWKIVITHNIRIFNNFIINKTKII